MPSTGSEPSTREAQLERRVEELEERVRCLAREVPLGAASKLKVRRLGLPVKELQRAPNKDGVEWPAERVRDTFISFFEDRYQHTFWKSSPVVPHNDPTLLFANAGMNQYKPLFLGQADPNTAMSKLKRAVNSQKCIRAGGKHNDLEDVGKDVYHHTYFEMLGNWSFGDYFKAEAIRWAWELLTEVYQLPEDRLYVTYFQGDDSCPADEEAKELWKKYVPEDRIIGFDAKDNFWEMGDVGPCGPCSEIHFDRIGGRDASSLVNMDDPDVLEIWNLVFIQFNRKPGGALERLPACHVDTGMGFERLTSVLQDKRSNYDTDIFWPLFDAIHKVADGIPAYGGKLGEGDEGNIDMAYRVVADHIRTLSFAIADGAFPSNEGRGYVLRRVLRRAVRYGQEILKMPKGAFASLVHVLANMTKSMFPELFANRQLVYDVVLDEEVTFARTLAKGVIRFGKEADALVAKKETMFPGKLAFLLFDSMGFPVDLTELMAEERGLTLDVDGFNRCLEAHKAKSKLVAKGGDGGGSAIRKFEAKETSHLEEALGLSPTDHSLVYRNLEDLPGCTVQAIFDGERFVDSVALGGDDSDSKQYGFVLDQSNFYYESGGQLSDTGKLRLENTELCLSVMDCQSSKGFIVHAGTLSVDEDFESPVGAKAVKVGDKVCCEVDYSRRSDLAKNHTCTHLLNFALRKVVADNVDQKGSLVSEDKFRFDFNSLKAIDTDSLMAIESIVRKTISDALPVHTKVVPLADAMRVNSLRAVFGETYPDPVRVVTIGPKVEEVVADPLNPKWKDYSVELCGGTHLSKSSEARAFALVSEGGLAKGIRRVVCLTGEAAFAAEREAEELMAKIEAAFSLEGAALLEEQKKLNTLVEGATVSVCRKKEIHARMEQLTRKMLDMQKELLKKLTDEVLQVATSAAAEGKKFVVHVVSEGGSNCPKILGDVVKKTKKSPISLFLVQAGDSGGSVLFSVAVAKPDQKALSAKDWLLTAGSACGAQGGGSAAVCNGKGSDVAKIPDCVKAAQDFAASKLS